MHVESDFYLIFYDLILAEFIKEFYSEPPTKRLVDTGEVWAKQKNGKNGKNLGDYYAVIRFDLIKNSYKYFFLRKKIIDTAVLNKKVVPQKVSINNRSLCKALNFIHIKPSDKPEDFYKLTELEQVAWLATTQWDTFKEIYRTEVNEKGSVINRNTYVSIPNFLTSPDNIPEFSICKKIVTEFIDNLSSKKYHDAWIMLTPHYQTVSLWGNSFAKFSHSFENLNVSKEFSVTSMAYMYKYLRFRLGLRNIKTVYNIVEMLKNFALMGIKLPYRYGPLLDKTKVSSYSVIEQINFNLRTRFNGQDLSNLDASILMNYDFQRHIFIDVSNFNKIKNDLPELERLNVIESIFFDFQFANDKWLINSLHDLEPMDLDEKLNPKRKVRHSLFELPQ